MPRPMKGTEPLAEPLRIKITKRQADALDAEALAQSKPGAIRTRSEIARDAIDEGLPVLKRKRQKKG